MADARSYRPGGTATEDGRTPSAAVNPAFLDPKTYDEYLIASRADALSPTDPARNPAYLASLAAAHPGATPDAVVAAASAGLAPGSAEATALAGLTQSQKAEQIAQSIAQEQKRRWQEINDGPVGFLKSLSRTATNALEAPFQIEMNAVNYAAAKSQGLEQPDGIGIAQVFTNTDVGWQVTNLQDGNEGFEQGDGWFTDPTSSGAMAKQGMDVDLAGGLSATMGQRLADVTPMPKGSTGYSMFSGTVDALSRVFDPSMYVGTGEVKALVRGAQGATAAKAADLVKVGSAAAHADDAIAPAVKATSAAFDSAQAANEAAKRVSRLEEAIAEAQAQHQANVVPKIAEVRAAAVAAGVDADTAVANAMGRLSEQSLESWRQQLLDASAAKKQVEHELADTYRSAGEQEAAARALKEQMLGEGHILPEPPQGALPNGLRFADEPERIFVREDPEAGIDTTAADAPWDPKPLLAQEGELGAEELWRHSVKDSAGREVGVLYTDAQGVVQHVGVDPAFRRKGIGTALFDYASEHAQAAGRPAVQHSSDVSEAGAAFREAELSRHSDVDPAGLEELAQSRHADDVRSWQETYGDADDTIKSWLTLPQRAMYEKHGVLPLAVIRKHLNADVSDLGSSRVEEISALIRSGSPDLERDAATHGASKPLGDWESEAFTLGKSKVKYVKVPWKRTKTELADSLETHKGAVLEEARAARAAQNEQALAEWQAPLVASATGSADDAAKVVAALEKVAPDLAGEFGVAPGVFRATGDTPGAVIDSVARNLQDAGVAVDTQARILYSLNDDLLAKANVVVDGHPLLAPAGRGRAVAEQHQAMLAAGDQAEFAAEAMAPHLDSMTALADDAKQAIRDLDDARVNRLGEKADRLSAKADSVEAAKLKAHAARLASLERRRQEVLAEVTAHEAARDENLALVNLLSSEAARKAGVAAPTGDPADHINFLKDLAGLRKTADGTDVADLDRGMKFLIGTDAEPLYRAVAAIDNPATIHTLTRGKLPARMTTELADAKTIEDVRGVFVKYAGRGMVDETTGRLMGLRVMGRAAMGGIDPDKALTRYEKAFASAPKAVEWSYAAARRNVPWSNSRHIEDVEGMTNLTSDSINYMLKLWRPTSKAEARAFHDQWVNTMLRTNTAEERRTVWYGMLDALSERAAVQQGLTPEQTEAFMGALKASRARQRSLTTYTAEARAANGGTPLTLNGQSIPKDIATLEAEMSTRVMSPDWREMRRALKSAKSLERASQGNPELRQAMLEAQDAVLDKFWRTSVLAFRGGYVLRNMADIQARMFLSGHPSVFTSPHGLVALALSHRLDPQSAVGRMIRRAERADSDIDGSVFSRLEGEDGDLFEAIDGFRRVQARDVSLLDPGSPSRAMRLGEVPVGPDHPLFFRGWGNELGLMWSSPMASDVLRVLSGSPSKALKRHMSQTGITDTREALVDYLWDGAGKARVDRLKELSATLGDKIKTRADLEAYLFGDEAVSLASRWRRLTLDLDPAIVKHTLSGGVLDEVPESMSVKAGQAFLARRDATAKLLKDTAKDRVQDPAFPVQQVRTPVWADRQAKNAFGQRVEAATDAFFTFSSHIEKDLGYLPEFRYAKWDKAAQLASALSPEDAARLVTNAEAVLGGIPGSWAKNTLAELKRQAGKASGDGGFTLSDLKGVTDEHGVNHVKTLFYDAQKRNAVGHALRLASPFAQAWGNSLRVWGKLAATNTKQVYKAQLLYTAGQGPGTAWFTDDPSNPDDAMFYSDPKTRQQMVGIPVAGSVLAAIGSLVSVAHGGEAIDPSTTSAASPLSSFNLLFQNGMLPGVGPAISIPASALDGSDTYQAAVPDWMKRALVPYTNVDPDRDPGVLEATLPGWFGTVAAGVGVPGFSERVTKYVKPAMAQLFSKHPERYLNEQGLMDNAGQARLLKDANALAHGITFGKGLLQNMSAGSLQPDLLVKSSNGDNLSQTVLTKEYGDLVRQTGSRDAALGQMLDKYGVDPLLTMLPNREFGYTPSDGAYQFVKANPEVADQHGAVLSLFLPAGGYSAYMDRWARKRGTNPALTPDQAIDYSNGLLYNAQQGALDRKLVTKEITQDQYDAQTATLKAAYKEAPQAATVNNSRDVAVREVRDALGEPSLANTEAGHAAAVYMALRDQAIAQSGGGALGGKGDLPLRAWLREQGNELVAQYPEFSVMWTQVFRGEVKD